MKKLMIFALMLMPVTLTAQHPRTARATMKTAVRSMNSLADSANYKFEFGSDLNVAQSNDSLPADVRIGYIAGNTFTVEARAAAQEKSNQLNADLSLNLTAAIFPGATSVHGQYVEGGAVYRYTDGAYQYGVSFGTGARLIATNGIAARTGAFVQHLFARNGAPSTTTVGARVGISFWR